MKGFHLIEVLVTLAIIMILAASSIPTYSHYLMYEKRLEAASALAKLAIKMEHYHIEHNTYQEASLQTLQVPGRVARESYQLMILSATNNTYVLSAMPLGHQAEKDRACGILSLDSTGKKSISGLGNLRECW